MIFSSLIALAVLSSPGGAELPRGTFDSVVPRLPGGYGPGQVSIRVHAVQMPQSSSNALVGDLVARTGVAVTETQGIRMEMVLPDDVDFESLRARVVDGLVLQPRQRSLLGRVGSAVVSLLRILLVGRLISATDDLAMSGAVWAAALGTTSAEDEIVRLSTTDELVVDRSAPTFSDHGEVVICRSMLALSPWTELVEIELRCRDLVSGKRVSFFIPRLPLHGNARQELDRKPNPQWVMAAER